MTKVSVAVPMYKHPDLAESFLQRFFANTVLKTDDYEVELVVCDDASESEELAKVLVKYQDEHSGTMKVIVRQENGGFPGASNTAIAHSTGDYVICLSSDVQVLDPRWIDALVAPQRSLKCITGGQYIDYNSLTFVDTTMVPYIGGWCMCLPRKFLDELATLLKSSQVFEESFKPGYFEDVLVSFYAKYVLGYELVAPSRLYPDMDVFLHHIGGQTLNQNSFPTEIIAERNRLVFMDKVRLALTIHGISL